MKNKKKDKYFLNEGIYMKTIQDLKKEIALGSKNWLRFFETSRTPTLLNELDEFIIYYKPDTLKEKSVLGLFDYRNWPENEDLRSKEFIKTLNKESYYFLGKKSKN